MEENNAIDLMDQDYEWIWRRSPWVTRVARIASRYQTVFCKPLHSSWRVRWYSARNVEQLIDGNWTVLCEYSDNICEYLDKIKSYYENN